MTTELPRRPGLARSSRYEEQMAEADEFPGAWIKLPGEFNNPQTARGWFRDHGFRQTSKKLPDGKHHLWIMKEPF